MIFDQPHIIVAPVDRYTDFANSELEDLPLARNCAEANAQLRDVQASFERNTGLRVPDSHRVSLEPWPLLSTSAKLAGTSVPVNGVGMEGAPTVVIIGDEGVTIGENPACTSPECWACRAAAEARWALRNAVESAVDIVLLRHGDYLLDDDDDVNALSDELVTAIMKVVAP